MASMASGSRHESGSLHDSRSTLACGNLRRRTGECASPVQPGSVPEYEVVQC